MMNGYCTNLPSACSKAASKALIPMSMPDSKCPECGSGLLPARDEAKGGKPLTTIIVLGVLVLLVLGAIAAVVMMLSGDKPDAPVAPPSSSITPAPVPVPAPPPTPTPTPTPQPVPEPPQSAPVAVPPPAAPVSAPANDSSGRLPPCGLNDQERRRLKLCD